MHKKNVMAAFVSAPVLMSAVAPLAAQESSLVLEEIVVTAQRTSESLQDVPVSMLAVSDEALESRNLNDLQQLSLAAPGLQVGQDNSFAMRGVGTLVFGNTVDSSVALAVDDVNYGRPALGGAAFNDIERVEVLYGPQGLLFGKNASAGLLNVITTRPQFDEFSGEVSAELALRDTTPKDATGLLTKATLNAPVGDNAALRFNALYSDQEPVAAMIGGGGSADENAEQYALKAKYLHELSDSLELYVIADVSSEAGIAGIFDRTLRQVGEGSPANEVLAADGITAGDDNLEFAADGDYYRDLDTGGLQASLSYSFDNGFDLFSVTSWRYFDLEQQIDTDYLSIDGLSRNASDTHYDQYSQELRLALPNDNRLNGQVGVFYFYSEVDTYGELAGSSAIPGFVLAGFPFCVGSPDATDALCAATGTANSSFLGSDNQSSLTTESMALFGQFNYELSDSLSLIAGARVTQDDVDIDLTSGTGADGYFVNIGGATGQFSESQSNTNVSWKLGTQFYIAEDVMAYASVSTGYKAPGFNDSAASELTPLAVAEETSTNLEAGIKSTVLGGRVNLNASVFRQEFEDYQVQSFDTGAQTFITQNAAEVTTQGLELNVKALLAENVTLTNATTLLDSTFDDFPGTQCYPGQADCSAEGTFNAAGRTLPLAAEVTSTTQIMVDFDLNDSVSGYVESSWYYRSAINFKVNEAPGTELDAINVIGFSLGLRSTDGWSVSLFCKNCTDEKVPTFIDFYAGDALEGIATYVQAWGFNSVRTLGLNIGYEF
ncbi:TonB-dependent receptor [Halioxenophilus aromaticivorans]|uniref:TonB-dependent receptor n=1 Tax=Halioxenophilus aromaticivorans TaxID=1306992 RepID=A0AAV3U3V5_9ALTE